MADLILTETTAHRPRNVDWKRAAALLYGDWGTSKAYVIGLAFVAAGFASLPIILAVCALTGLVGINYAVICRYFPDGGGVYSAAKSQGRLLAVVGALLLVADLTVTAALKRRPLDVSHFPEPTPGFEPGTPSLRVKALAISFGQESQEALTKSLQISGSLGVRR